MAYVSHKLKLALIRVPKTGSSSQVRALFTADPETETIGGPHADAIDGRHHFDKWHEYRKIGFIRHPYKWVQSYANFAERLNCAEGSLARDPVMFASVCCTPLAWLSHPCTDELLVDEVWRTEDLPDFFDMLGVPHVMAHVTTNIRRRKWDKTPELMAALHKNFDREFPFYENTRT